MRGKRNRGRGGTREGAVGEEEREAGGPPIAIEAGMQGSRVVVVVVGRR